MTQLDHQITRGSADIAGQHVEWLEAGTGPLAICLHGFPDSAYTWRHLLPALAAAGYRAVAPWTRGYAPSSVAADGLYQSGVRAHDACRLHEELGGDGDAVLIGHDFGASTAVSAVAMEPERWKRVVLMSVPPGGRFATAMFQYEQNRRSSYMFFFQHPLSEIVLPHDDWAYVRGLWNAWSPGFDGSEDIAHFIDAVSPDGHLAGALGYYRAIFQPDLQSPDYEDWQASAGSIPDQPTLYLHGRNDGCIGVEVAAGLDADLAEGSEVHLLDDAGHFLHLEHPAAVNATIIDFVTR